MVQRELLPILFPVKQLAVVAAGNDGNTKSLLHFDGTDGSTTITDSALGGGAKTWTCAGNAQIDTADAKFGPSSMLMDGTGDDVSTPFVSGGDFDPGNGSFTFDTWFKVAGGNGTIRMLFNIDDGSEANPGMRLQLTAANVLQLGFFWSGGNAFCVGATAFTAGGAWAHVAAVRTGSTLKMFVNGAQEGGDQSVSTNAMQNTGTTVWAGRAGANRFYWNGWFDEMRFSNIARWTGAFTPPSSPYGP